MYRRTIFFAITGIILAGCSELPGPNPPADPVSVTYLDQGWGAEMRDLFYYTPQGSQLIPYRWFLALEHPSGAGLLRDDGHFERLRFVTDRTSRTDLNPDGLPVGFAREPNPGGEDWLGLTCSACHTSQIEYEGATIRIDGGPALADMTGMIEGRPVREQGRRTCRVDGVRRWSPSWVIFNEQWIWCVLPPTNGNESSP